MRTFRLNREPKPWLEIGSHGRAGPSRRPSLTPADLESIRRTVTRAPEVMVKVTSGSGSNTSRGVNAHFNYISRKGELEIETDDGKRLIGQEAGKQLTNDWDLDLDEDRKRPGLFVTNRRKPPKLIRKIMFSMPAGTPPEKVLAAVRDFTRDEFGLKHRYAMVLHTNEPHPHVHLAVKAVSENGVRLDIRRATLRRWRQEFARQLRAQGVESNATERRVRGQSRAPKLDPIFRAAQRGKSTHMVARVHEVVRELNTADLDNSGVARLLRTRRDVVRGWQGVRDLLVTEGKHQLADQVLRFVDQMPPPRTEKQWLLFSVLNNNHSPASAMIPPEPPARDSSKERYR